MNLMKNAMSTHELNTNAHINSKRDSNLSSSTDFLTSGLSANEIDNPSCFALSIKNGNQYKFSQNRGSQIVPHSTFMRDISRNRTFCPQPIKRQSVYSLKGYEDKIEVKQNEKEIVIASKEQKTNDRDKEVKGLLRNNILREYENRIRNFLRNEKFFLNATNNLKINIPFAYLVKPNLLKKSKNINENDFTEYKALTERKARSVPKNISSPSNNQNYLNEH